MPETTTERLAALIGLVAAIALFLVALTGRTDEASVNAAATEATDPLPATRESGTEEPAARIASRPVTNRPAPAETATLVLTAARGDCWLSIHAGTPDGNLLYEGVLTSGKTLRVQGSRLWVRLGAAANLDLTLNGKRVAALAAGTFDVVATPQGVRPAT